MSQSTLRRAIGAVKDQTSISLAKVGSSSSLGDLEVAIVKATKHAENPAAEKHVREILSLTCYSRAFISACVNTLAKRLSKTSSWTVALKTLVLIQRLISEGDPAYEQEIFFSTRRGTRLLNMCDFRDKSKSNSWDYSSFVRTYALYLDERLEYKMQHRRGRSGRFSYDEDEEDQSKEKERDKNGEIVVTSMPLCEMKTEQLFSKMQHLQLLLERFMACRPTGRAKTHRIVIVALYPIVKESFQIYHDMTEILGIFIDRFTEIEIQECYKVYDIFCRIGKQYDELELFYIWSKSIGIGRSSEYPHIEKVTTKKLELVEQFIKDRSSLKEKTNTQEKPKEKEEEKEIEMDMNEIKALPPPEEFNEEPIKEVVKEEKEQEKEIKEENIVQTEGDLLGLGDNMMIKQDYNENKLALALFDGELSTTKTTAEALPWQAFDDESDWETSLVQSSSNLPNQKPSLGGGFDTLLLDSMYEQSSTRNVATMQGVNGYGSASSVARVSATPMLALPAPQTSRNGYEDPFAASMALAPPAYVQMSEIEKRQRLLLDEQAMWQQYAKSGIQGHVGFQTQQQQQQPNNFYMGGYQQNHYGNYYH
ncbi:putative clathrin assembly protein At4g02650 [Vicia villosa]|uniref:putative clathrin assembly protein At4g02650 n=1 Tax=Vicia villosa TaxID=3911 RepID=UPI00273B1488|nr:putative clathrin assembly protein At4g02650 [Vicia villosa]